MQGIAYIISITKEVRFYERPLKLASLLMILALAVRMDYRNWKISNHLILAGISAGVVFLLRDISVQNTADFLGGLLLPVLICWIPFRMHAIGAGDIKLFSVIGCINGSREVLYCIIFSFLAAAGISLGRLLSQKQLWTSLTGCVQYFYQILSQQKIMPYPGREEPGHRIHFSMSILLGFVACMGVNMCGIII